MLPLMPDSLSKTALDEAASVEFPYMSWEIDWAMKPLLELSYVLELILLSFYC